MFVKLQQTTFQIQNQSDDKYQIVLHDFLLYRIAIIKKLGHS